MGAKALMCFCLLPVVGVTAELGVDEILNRYRAALGGQEALDAVATMEIFGTVEGMGLSGTTYSVQDSSGNVMERIDIGPLSYAWAHGRDDGWIQDHSGTVRSLSPAELEEFLLLAQVGGVAPIGEEFRDKMRVSAPRSDSSHICIEVTHEGSPVELYFRRSTNLLDKVRMTKLGMPVEAVFSDFRSIEGVTLPFRGIQTVAGLFSLEMKVARVVVNGPVSPAVFRRPGSPTMQGQRCAVPISVDGHLVAPVSLDGGARLRFYIDSGAGMSCIDRDVASRLGLTSRGALPAQGVMGLDSVGIATVATLAVGCLTMEQARLAVVDLSMMNLAEDEPVHGILGYGLFSQRSVGRAGGADSLILGPPGSAPHNGHVTLPLQFVANVPVVEAAVEGKKGRFIVDTGSSFELIIHTPFAARESLLPSPEALTSRPAAGIGGGGEAFMGTVGSFDIGGIRLGRVQALFSPSGRGVTAAEEVAGNIGLPLLERFDWILDYQGAALYLEPRRTTHHH